MQRIKPGKKTKTAMKLTGKDGNATVETTRIMLFVLTLISAAALTLPAQAKTAQFTVVNETHGLLTILAFDGNDTKCSSQAILES